MSGPSVENDALREALTPGLMEMLAVRFPAWGRDGEDYRYAEFIDRIAGFAADAGCHIPPEETARPREEPWEWHPDDPEAHALLEKIQDEEKQ